MPYARLRQLRLAGIRRHCWRRHARYCHCCRDTADADDDATPLSFSLIDAITPEIAIATPTHLIYWPDTLAAIDSRFSDIASFSYWHFSRHYHFSALLPLRCHAASEFSGCHASWCRMAGYCHGRLLYAAATPRLITPIDSYGYAIAPPAMLSLLIANIFILRHCFTLFFDITGDFTTLILPVIFFQLIFIISLLILAMPFFISPLRQTWPLRQAFRWCRHFSCFRYFAFAGFHAFWPLMLSRIFILHYWCAFSFSVIFRYTFHIDLIFSYIFSYIITIFITHYFSNTHCIFWYIFILIFSFLLSLPHRYFSASFSVMLHISLHAMLSLSATDCFFFIYFTQMDITQYSFCWLLHFTLLIKPHSIIVASASSCFLFFSVFWFHFFSFSHWLLLQLHISATHFNIGWLLSFHFLSLHIL